MRSEHLEGCGTAFHDAGFLLGVEGLEATKLFGAMSEWSKEHAWKVCKRQKRFEGSNPFLSALK